METILWIQYNMDPVTKLVIDEESDKCAETTVLNGYEISTTTNNTNSSNKEITPKISTSKRRSYKSRLASNCRKWILCIALLVLGLIGIFIFFVVYKNKGNYKLINNKYILITITFWG